MRSFKLTLKKQFYPRDPKGPRGSKGSKGSNDSRVHGSHGSKDKKLVSRNVNWNFLCFLNLKVSVNLQKGSRLKSINCYFIMLCTSHSLLFRLAVAILCNLGPIFLTANKLVFFIVTLKLQNRCYIILYTATRSIRGRSYVDACFEDYQIIIFLSMGCHWTQYIYQDSKIFPTLHQYCPSNS